MAVSHREAGIGVGWKSHVPEWSVGWKAAACVLDM
jgi:hypothetical protein